MAKILINFPSQLSKILIASPILPDSCFFISTTYIFKSNTEPQIWSKIKHQLSTTLSLRF